MPNQPTVVVPMNEQMAQEPARAIGEQFANSAYVKGLVLAAFAIVGAIAPHLVPQLTDSLATSISTIVVAIVTVVAAQQARATPKQQAEKTREAVYAPATVATIVNADQPKEVDAVVIPAPAPDAA